MYSVYVRCTSGNASFCVFWNVCAETSQISEHLGHAASLQQALAEVQQLVGVEDTSGNATTSTSKDIECLVEMFDLHQLRRAQTYEMILDRAREVRDRFWHPSYS